MARLVYQVMQDNAGNLLFGVTGTVRLAGTGTLATIYGDEAGTIPIANPLTNHASFGSFKFYVGPGSYDFYLAKAGYTFETLTGVQGSGTMAAQNATAVAITGGDASLQRLGVGAVAPVTSGTTILNGAVGIQHAPQANIALWLGFSKSVQAGIQVQALENDAGGNPAVSFNNVAGTGVGSITTTASATAYNTSSDGRLKKMVEMFEGALDLVHQLRPVRFRWRADESEGQGFLANEVQQVIDGVVTGEPDAMNEDGSIRSQQIDHSKLVPLLTAAVKELSAQVQTLTVRVRELELLSVS